jgi:hypothetical protein
MGTWRLEKTVGGFGHSVQVWRRGRGERRRYYLRWWEQGRYGRKSLRHGEGTRAEAQALELMRRLLSVSRARAGGPLTLGSLFALYEDRVSQHKKGRQLEEDRRRMDLWEAVLGAEHEVATLSHDELDAFVRARVAGTIVVPWRRYAGAAAPAPTRALEVCSGGTAGADIVFLQAVCNWATRTKRPDGTVWLAAPSPLYGYARPENLNPRRPLASYDRFRKLRKVADRADPQRLFGAFLDLVEALGWRVTALCQLWASDVDLRRGRRTPYGRIRKRGAVDKEGVEMWVPLSPDARRAIERVLQRNAVVGDRPLFPAPKGKGLKAWNRSHARDLLERTEALAKLEPIAGGDFHPYRRKWATERKHLPTPDVMAAGAWRDRRSLETAYQQDDAETVLAVVLEPRKLREAK